MIKFLIATYFFLFLTSDFLEITTTSSAVPGTGWRLALGWRPVARSHNHTPRLSPEQPQSSPALPLMGSVSERAPARLIEPTALRMRARAIFRSITTLQCTEKSRPIEISRISRWFRHWFSFDVASA